MHTKVCKKFDVNRVILPQTIMNMKTSGGLSTVLKQSITGTKVAIVDCMAVVHIAEAIRRLGFVDIVSVHDCTNLPVFDVAICTCTDKEDCRAVVTHYNNVGIIPSENTP